MTDPHRLTQAQLVQLVAEVEHLSRRQQDELSSAQVREILVELNLPPDLLEEAIVQLQRRQVLAVRQQRRQRWVSGLIVAIVIVSLGVGIWIHQQQQGLRNINAQQDRITLAQDDGGTLDAVSRSAGNELFYRVTLDQAPVGQKLSLVCNWVDPMGQVVHQNRYQTQTVTTPVWTTFCRHRIGTAAPAGTWTVQLFLGNRLLSDAQFKVQ